MKRRRPEHRRGASRRRDREFDARAPREPVEEPRAEESLCREADEEAGTRKGEGAGELTARGLERLGSDRSTAGRRWPAGETELKREVRREALYASGVQHEPAGAHVHQGQQSAGRGRGGRSDDRRPPPGALYLGQSEPAGADACRRRSDARRKLDDPEIPGRKIRPRRLSEGSEEARQGQRDDGLVQHPLLSRLRLRRRLSADLSRITSGRATRCRRARSPGRRNSPRSGCRC